jgi:hypothetical protein
MLVEVQVEEPLHLEEQVVLAVEEMVEIVQMELMVLLILAVAVEDLDNPRHRV